MKPLGIGALLLAATVVAVASLVALEVTGRIVACPVGYLTAQRGVLDHQYCEACRRTGKVTLLESARILFVHKGRWPKGRTWFCS